MKGNTFDEFDKTTLSLLKLLLSLSEEQLNFQPKEGWSAGQLGEHILKSYASVETLNGKTRKTERPKWIHQQQFCLLKKKYPKKI